MGCKGPDAVVLDMNTPGWLWFSVPRPDAKFAREIVLQKRLQAMRRALREKMLPSDTVVLLC